MIWLYRWVVGLSLLVSFISPVVFVYYLCAGIEKLRKEESYISEQRICAVSFVLPFACFYACYKVALALGVRLWNYGFAALPLWIICVTPIVFVYQLFPLVEHMLRSEPYEKERFRAALAFLLSFGPLILILTTIMP